MLVKFKRGVFKVSNLRFKAPMTFRIGLVYNLWAQSSSSSVIDLMSGMTATKNSTDAHIDSSARAVWHNY